MEVLKIADNGTEKNNTSSPLRFKLVEDYDTLARIVEGYKARQHKVAVTIGSFDVLHVGHFRYLWEARKQGDLLVVGVDTDRILKTIKDETRPIIPFGERVEALAYQSYVDLITPVDDLDENGSWAYGLLRRLRPDVFVAEKTSYPDRQIAEITRLCGRIAILDRQAEGTSTSQIIQRVIKPHIEEVRRLATRE